jgi:hypothetical protein
MSSITEVKPAALAEFISELANESVDGSVPLSTIVEVIQQDKPQYDWFYSYMAQDHETWTVSLSHFVLSRHALTIPSQITDRDKGTPVLVSFAGLVKSCASRAHGNYVPSGHLPPPEYESNRM